MNVIGWVSEKKKLHLSNQIELNFNARIHKRGPHVKILLISEIYRNIQTCLYVCLLNG